MFGYVIVLATEFLLCETHLIIITAYCILVVESHTLRHPSVICSKGSAFSIISVSLNANDFV